MHRTVGQFLNCGLDCTATLFSVHPSAFIRNACDVISVMEELMVDAAGLKNPEYFMSTGKRQRTSVKHVNGHTHVGFMLTGVQSKSSLECTRGFNN